MNNNFLFKALFLLFLVVFFFLLPWIFDSKGKAAYSTDGSASVSSTLTLVILPALEHMVLQAEQTDATTTSYLIGLRANTSWAFDYDVQSTGSQPICNDSDPAGRRNLDSSFQLISITCEQPWSWADSDPIEQSMTYTLTQTLGAGS
jgi:hypothetical protein